MGKDKFTGLPSCLDCPTEQMTCHICRLLLPVFAFLDERYDHAISSAADVAAIFCLLLRRKVCRSQYVLLLSLIMRQVWSLTN